MSKIKIQHFGPIREGFTENNGWMDINKVTVFIGNQGSGKSTVAKLISSFLWLEKALVRGDAQESHFEDNNEFVNQILAYHRLNDYLNVEHPIETYIGYDGLAYKIEFENRQLKIYPKKYEYYPLPQIMYVPAERNFLSYVKSPKELKLISEALQEFLAEFENAKSEISGFLRLPINNAYLKYDKVTDTLSLSGNGYNNLKLTDASSGFQSIVPLYLVSGYLAHTIHNKLKVKNSTMSVEELQRFRKEFSEIYNNDSLTQEQKRAATSILSEKFNKSAFINIIEEPEQNLFPSSQWEMLQSLMEFNSYEGSSKLIMTTHSPYIISFLSILILGNEVGVKQMQNIMGERKDVPFSLAKILNVHATIKSELVSVYEMNEQDGTIHKLPNEYGIPSDNNYLNMQLRKSNEIFDKLLEIEQSLSS
jgi:predicted ATPase